MYIKTFTEDQNYEFRILEIRKSRFVVVKNYFHSVMEPEGTKNS